MAQIRTTLVWLAALGLVMAAVACSDDTTPPTIDTAVQDDSAVNDTFVGQDSGADAPVTKDSATDTTPTKDTAPNQDKGGPNQDKGGPNKDKGGPNKDFGPGGCKSNANCTAKNQFCNLKLGCIPPGVCTTKPVACPSVYKPVCGCDNKTYSNSCMANAAGVSVKSNGVCTAKSCKQIRADYAAAIVAAKKCSPMLPVVQCVTVVTKDLACGCTTSVNKNNVTDYAKILSLQTLWKTQNCASQPWNCPKIPCKSVSKGICDTTSSTCIDQP